MLKPNCLFALPLLLPLYLVNVAAVMRMKATISTINSTSSSDSIRPDFGRTNLNGQIVDLKPLFGTRNRNYGSMSLPQDREDIIVAARPIFGDIALITGKEATTVIPFDSYLDKLEKVYEIMDSDKDNDKKYEEVILIGAKLFEAIPVFGPSISEAVQHLFKTDSDELIQIRAMQQKMELLFSVPRMDSRILNATQSIESDLKMIRKAERDVRHVHVLLKELRKDPKNPKSLITVRDRIKSTYCSGTSSVERLLLDFEKTIKENCKIDDLDQFLQNEYFGTPNYLNTNHCTLKAIIKTGKFERQFLVNTASYAQFLLAKLPVIEGICYSIGSTAKGVFRRMTYIARDVGNHINDWTRRYLESHWRIPKNLIAIARYRVNNVLISGNFQNNASEIAKAVKESMDRTDSLSFDHSVFFFDTRQFHRPLQSLKCASYCFSTTTYPEHEPGSILIDNISYGEEEAAILITHHDKFTAQDEASLIGTWLLQNLPKILNILPITAFGAVRFKEDICPVEHDLKKIIMSLNTELDRALLDGRFGTILLKFDYPVDDYFYAIAAVKIEGPQPGGRTKRTEWKVEAGSQCKTTLQLFL